MGEVAAQEANRLIPGPERQLPVKENAVAPADGGTQGATGQPQSVFESREPMVGA